MPRTRLTATPAHADPSAESYSFGGPSAKAQSNKGDAGVAADPAATPSDLHVRLRREVAAFQGPILHRSLLQLATSFGGFFGTLVAMYTLFDLSYALVLALAPLAAGFLVRIFIIQHDCGHGSFLPKRWANDAIGRICSLLTLTPYASWRRQHAGHHGIWNDLDRRANGVDIYSSCLTADEYRALGPRQQWWHRATRHPIVANVLLPPLVFLVLYRFPFDTPPGWRRERRAVYVTNIALIAAIAGVGGLVGYSRLAAVQLPVMVLASIIGVWLFSVQHRFEEAWWARHDRWHPADAAMHGSSFLRLPRVLQWFTGNIGFHHVHHLNPLVPNYRLQACHERIAPLVAVPELSLWDGLRASRYVLFDEARSRMVTFREAAAPSGT